MDRNIIYRLAEEDDYPAILILYNKMYKTNRSLNDFRWLVEENPAGRAKLFIALMNDRVVGMQSLIPYVFVQNGMLVNTFKSEDTLVEKDLRGKGIFSKLYEMVHAHAGDTMVWGLTDKKEILERVKMPSSERLTIAISVKRPSLVSDKKGLHRFVAKTLFYAYLYLKSSFKSTKVRGSLKLKEIGLSDFGSVELQEFFGKMFARYPQILFPQMNAKYLKWRLANNPNLNSYIIEVSYQEDGSIAICSILGFSEKAAYWQSYYSLPDVSMDDKIAHIISVRNKVFESKINLIHTWLFECNSSVKEVKEIFYQAGFSKVRDGLWIVHNSTDKEIDVHDLYFSPQLGIR